MLASAHSVAIAADMAERFLAALASPEREAIADLRVAIVVAHPDDETIGIGAQLRRLPNSTIVAVTDGAPRDESDAHAYGFSGWQDYAAARENELAAALAEAGIGGDRIVR